MHPKLVSWTFRKTKIDKLYLISIPTVIETSLTCCISFQLRGTWSFPKNLFNISYWPLVLIFHVVWFFNTNENATKNNWLRKFINDEVCFSKVTIQAYGVQTATLLSIDFTLGSFWNTYWALAALKRIYWERSLWWTSVLINLRPSSTQTPILSKNRVHVIDVSVEATKILMYSQEKHPWWRVLFSQVAGLDLMPAI